MKKTIFTLLSVLLVGGLANAQTMVYNIPFSGLVGLELTSGDICSPPFSGPEEAKQVSIGNQWGCTWTSTGTGVASTVDVELMFTINDQFNIPTLLNGTANSGQGASSVSCAASTLLSWSVDPTTYVVAGSNTFLADYAGSSQINQIDHLTAGVQDIYMRVTVTYVACTAPTAVVTTNKDVTCNGGSDGDINITPTGTSPFTYDWDNDGTGDFDDLEDLIGLSAGTYNVVVKDANGCTVALSHTVNEPAAIDVSVTVAGSDLTANASGLAYQWVNCPGMTAISGATSVTYTATVDGDYAVIVTDGPCSDTSICNTISGAGFSDNPGLGLEIYPNPTNGLVMVKVNNLSGLATVQLLDIAGKEVMIKSLSTTATQIELDLSEFENGTYILRLFDDKGQTESVIVKE